MPRGELFINKDELGNWKDAFTYWGLSMDDTGLSSLMTPAPIKDLPTDESRLEDGIRIDHSNVKYDSRDLTLSVHIKAPTKEKFFEYYKSFCSELKKGKLLVKTKYSDEVYKLTYRNCTQFSQFVQKMAFFSLKLTEENPEDRS